MLRVPVLLTLIGVGAIQVAAPNAFRAAMLNFSGESDNEDVNERVIELNGHEYVYNGTDHRWLLYEFYKEPLQNAGLLGYGNLERDKSDLVEAENVRWFWSLDNYYIALKLRGGELGYWLYAALAILPLIPLGRLAWQRHDVIGLLAAGLLSALTFFNLLLFTVNLTIDFQPYWSFITGLAVTVSQYPRVAPPRGMPRPANMRPLPAHRRPLSPANAPPPGYQGAAPRMPAAPPSQYPVLTQDDRLPK